jgi:hypothetical protein
MLRRSIDPRTDDTIVYELLRTPRGSSEPEVAGTATFRGGTSRIDAPDGIRIAVEELLTRAFVDRVQANERPRGYRRTGAGMVDMLVPGMPEHFIARMRGLWLSYPDGSVVTAREATERTAMVPAPMAEVTEAPTPVVDPAVRRASLASSDRRLGLRPLILPHPPEVGMRPPDEAAGPSRTDCGWPV